jgi:hypothetical protein
VKRDRSDKSADGDSAEQPRSVAFHWLANMVLASLALFAGALFGEMVPTEQMGVAFVAVAAIALALVPLTRYWEKTGIEGRRKAAEQAKKAGAEKAPSDKTDGDDADTSGPPP